MDLQTVLLIVAVIVAVFIVFRDNKTEVTETFENPVVDGSPVVPATPALGEDNPIMQTYQQLINNGLWNPVESGADTFDNSYQNLLWEQRVLKNSEVNRHKLYYGSNVGKYPFVGRPTNIDHRVTLNPYVGFTRAMRAVKIRDTESVVPDKIENPAPPR